MNFRAQLWRQCLPICWCGHRAETWMVVQLLCCIWSPVFPNEDWCCWKPCVLLLRGEERPPLVQSACPTFQSSCWKFLRPQCPTSQQKMCTILFNQWRANGFKRFVIRLLLGWCRQINCGVRETQDTILSSKLFLSLQRTKVTCTAYRWVCSPRRRLHLLLIVFWVHG